MTTRAWQQHAVLVFILHHLYRFRWINVIMESMINKNPNLSLLKPNLHPCLPLNCIYYKPILHSHENDSSNVLPCLAGLFACPNPPAIFVSEDPNSRATIVRSISVWSQGSGGLNEEHGCSIRLYTVKLNISEPSLQAVHFAWRIKLHWQYKLFHCFHCISNNRTMIPK